MRTIEIATCCLAGLLAAGCDPDPDPASPDGGAVEDGGPIPPPPGTQVRTCAQIKAANPSAANGSQTVHWGGDPMKPYTVYCDGMEPGGSPREYLEVKQFIESSPRAANVSIIYLDNAVGAIEHQVQYTQFQRVRLVLGEDMMGPTAAIDVGDTTHTTTRLIPASSNVFRHPLLSNNQPITNAAYGVAARCKTPEGSGVSRDDTSLDASVDLSGTGFQLSNTPDAPAFMWTADGAQHDVTPTSATLRGFATSEDGCNFVAPRQLRWPLVNPTAGSGSVLPLVRMP